MTSVERLKKTVKPACEQNIVVEYLVLIDTFTYHLYIRGVAIK